MITTADEDRELAIRQAELEDGEARDDLAAFVQLFRPTYKLGWVHRELCDLCMAFTAWVATGTGDHHEMLTQWAALAPLEAAPRAEWNQPPQTGKSEIVSRFWPAWTLGHFPHWHWITGCYGQDFANGFGKDVRDIITSPRYQCIFPAATLGRRGKVGDGSERVNELTLTKGGSYNAVSVGGKGAGMPAQIFSIDDPVKGREEAESPAFQDESINWYTQTAQARLGPGGGIFLTMTRWAMKDLSGQLQRAEKAIPVELRRKWHRRSYPAIAMQDESHRKKGEAIHPERHSLQEWLARRAEMAALGQDLEWMAVYQQQPTDEAGTFFKAEWLQQWTEMPANLVNYMGTDFAIGTKKTAHYTALPIAGRAPNGHLYVYPELFRERGSPGPNTVREFIRLYKAYDIQASAWDNTMIGKSLKGTLEEEAEDADVDLNVWEFTPSRDKLTHAAALRALMSQGKVWFPPGSVFTEIWKPSLLSFGASTEDGDWDEIDGLAWLANMLNELTRAEVPVEKIQTDHQKEQVRKRTILRREEKPERDPFDLFGSPR